MDRFLDRAGMASFICGLFDGTPAWLVLRRTALLRR